MSEYTDKLKNPKWQMLRLEIFQRDNKTCVMCNDTETTLHVHHLVYERGREPWEIDPKFLVTMCEKCHSTTEQMIKSIRLISGNRDKMESLAAVVTALNNGAELCMYAVAHAVNTAGSESIGKMNRNCLHNMALTLRRVEEITIKGIKAMCIADIKKTQ